MSNKGRSGINRALSWLKKTLEITEKTTAPDSLMADVRSTIDVFGWERMAEAEFETATSGVGGSNVQFTSVPTGVVHLYLHASVRIDVAGPFNVWVGIRGPARGPIGTVACSPVAAAIDAQKVSPLFRPVILPEGFQLEGRSEAAVALGSVILEAFRIVLPVGEYIPPS